MWLTVKIPDDSSDLAFKATEALRDTRVPLNFILSLRIHQIPPSGQLWTEHEDDIDLRVLVPESPVSSVPRHCTFRFLWPCEPPTSCLEEGVGDMWLLLHSNLKHPGHSGPHWETFHTKSTALATKPCTPSHCFQRPIFCVFKLHTTTL